MKFHELDEECKNEAIDLVKDHIEEIDEQSDINYTYSRSEVVKLIEENAICFNIQYDEFKNRYVSYA